ncbi:MAG: glycosyltransferase family 39 protein [Candidatus Binatia bacterium]
MPPEPFPSASSPQRGARLLPAAVVFVLALAWLLLLRPYGFQLEDEGTILSWFDRVMRGQSPYVDFHTGYTPGFFAFGSAVFSVFGPSATAMRAVLAVMNALSAAGMAELTRRVAGNWLAPVPPLLWLAFMPVYVGEFAAFNIPYPTWPVTLAWVGIALAMSSWITRPRAVLLVVAGAAAALAMWMRPNSGAFALAAITWIVVAGAPRRSTLDRAAAGVAAGFMLAGVWYAFGFLVMGMDALVHLVPALAMAVLCVGSLASRLARGGASSDGAGTTASLALLATAFLLPTLAWALPLLGTLGLDKFLYEVFLVGADYQSLYYAPHPRPELYALLVVAAMLAIAVGGRLVRSGIARPLPLLVAVAVIGGAVKLMALAGGIAPEGLLHSITLQLENSSFWLAAVANFGIVAWLLRVRGDELAASAEARSLVVLSVLGMAMYLQMFPRSDFMHQISAVPLLAVAACGLLQRVASWWAVGAWPSSWNGRLLVRGGVQVAAASVLVLGFVEKAAGPLEAQSCAAPSKLISPRLAVRVEGPAGDELEAVAAMVALLRANTDEGEALWSFPATSGLLFAAGRTNVAPHDYWYPGRPDRAEEARVLGALREKKPRLIVTLNRGWNFFGDSGSYFDSLRDFARSEYRLVARRGRYDLLARRDAGFSSLPVVLPGGAGSATEAIEPNLERRRQAAWRWMDAMTPAEAAAAALPESRRDALLLLRALRDGGDLRGAGWAIAGFESADPRVRGEAVDAMLAMAGAYRSARDRLAGDFTGGDVAAFVEPWKERARALEDLEELRPFTDAVREEARMTP